MIETPVTVIMPAHNAELFIAQAIKSVLWQTYKSFQLWVLENGSSDATLEIAKSFHDERIKVFTLGKVGFSGALDFGIRNSTSPWLARMDADDIMLPDRLERQMEVLTAQPTLAFIGTWCAVMTPFGHILERRPLPPTCAVDTTRLATSRGFVDPSVVFSREAAINAGGIDMDFSVGDIALWFRLLAQGRGFQIGHPLHIYRRRPSSFSRTWEFQQECAAVWRKYVPGIKPRWNTERVPTPLWASIASLEMIVGDIGAVRRSADKLSSEGEHGHARAARVRAMTGYLGSLYYRFRNRNQYVHRLDLEDLLQELSLRFSQ
jgi:glycosyltransferase involved in cell wall biosynthesis